MASNGTVNLIPVSEIPGRQNASAYFQNSNFEKGSCLLVTLKAIIGKGISLGPIGPTDVLPVVTTTGRGAADYKKPR